MPESKTEVKVPNPYNFSYVALNFIVGRLYIGNPLRSDDAIGPLLVEGLSQRFSWQSDCVIDFEWVYQLQIENAEQWRRYENIIVVDADARALQPVSWREIALQRDQGVEKFNSHRQSPESIYQLMQEFFESQSSPLSTRVYVLGIQAERFEIGESLSQKSQEALHVAEKFLVEKIKGMLS